MVDLTKRAVLLLFVSLSPCRFNAHTQKAVKVELARGKTLTAFCGCATQRHKARGNEQNGHARNTTQCTQPQPFPLSRENYYSFGKNLSMWRLILKYMLFSISSSPNIILSISAIKRTSPISSIRLAIYFSSLPL